MPQLSESDKIQAIVMLRANASLAQVARRLFKRAKTYSFNSSKICKEVTQATVGYTHY